MSRSFKTESRLTILSKSPRLNELLLSRVVGTLKLDACCMRLLLYKLKGRTSNIKSYILLESVIGSCCLIVCGKLVAKVGVVGDGVFIAPEKDPEKAPGNDPEIDPELYSGDFGGELKCMDGGAAVVVMLGGL